MGTKTSTCCLKYDMFANVTQVGKFENRIWPRERQPEAKQEVKLSCCATLTHCSPWRNPKGHLRRTFVSLPSGCVAGRILFLTWLKNILASDCSSTPRAYSGFILHVCLSKELTEGVRHSLEGEIGEPPVRPHSSGPVWLVMRHISRASSLVARQLCAACVHRNSRQSRWGVKLNIVFCWEKPLVSFLIPPPPLRGNAIKVW